jgi:hypothetical protein
MQVFYINVGSRGEQPVAIETVYSQNLTRCKRYVTKNFPGQEARIYTLSDNGHDLQASKVGGKWRKKY